MTWCDGWGPDSFVKSPWIPAQTSASYMMGRSRLSPDTSCPTNFFRWFSLPLSYLLSSFFRFVVSRLPIRPTRASKIACKTDHARSVSYSTFRIPSLENPSQIFAFLTTIGIASCVREVITRTSDPISIF